MVNKPGSLVLLIEAEPKMRSLLRSGFTVHGFSVVEAENAADGLKIATFNPPDLVILDLSLPDLHGSEALERLRSWSNVPVIVLSAESNEDEMVRLLRSGADDYVAKPFGMAGLLARGQTVLRRQFKGAIESPVVVVGPLAVDLAGRTALLANTRIKLTRKEYHLLHILAKHVGLVVTHGQLLREIWADNQRHNIQYLRILVRKLRQKIEPDPNHPRLLITKSGIGYRLEKGLETSSTN
ncbi:response regulator transcription factor [Bradyrhizobium sp. 187]|jgi:two-component system KDP operon response regulator KdpE|nr:response regulator transcription factor [Bradyrhizobium sp. 187]